MADGQSRAGGGFMIRLQDLREIPGIYSDQERNPITRKVFEYETGLIGTVLWRGQLA